MLFNNGPRSHLFCLLLILAFLSVIAFLSCGGGGGGGSGQPQGVTFNVDDYGANPWDSNPDSAAIQACLDDADSGDTVTFTSGVNSPNYQGYLIDQTLFLVATAAKHDMVFTSTDPNNHALLKSTDQLKGYVVRLFARSRVADRGEIDQIMVSHLDIDGGKDVRRCFGSDGQSDGVDDNWGSWLPNECTDKGDSWCMAGSLAMDGEMDWTDASQDYQENPSSWSTDLVVDDVSITNTECGSALSLLGAGSTIQDSSVQDAGEHTHVAGCTRMDDDEGNSAWSDGITFSGPDHVVANNRITNASDVGIVFFGGHDTDITDNTITCSQGNHGMFAGIAVHPWIFGNVSGMNVSGNQVQNNGDTICGGIHSGINIGQHMWGVGCVTSANPTAVGNASCSDDSAPSGTLCAGGATCQEWAHVAASRVFILTNNSVTGAQINYLIEGLDLVGNLSESNNASQSAQATDWEAAKVGCDGTAEWGPLYYVAHHPTLQNWTDLSIHCER